MLKLRLYALALALAVVPLSAQGTDKGQWRNYKLSPQQRAWFETVVDTNGIKCCADADGFPVECELRGETYWVKMPNNALTQLDPSYRDAWLPVPETAVRRTRNPVHEAVAWFYYVSGYPAVKCFVPADLI
jgi:hypothetical protein